MPAATHNKQKQLLRDMALSTQIEDKSRSCKLRSTDKCRLVTWENLTKRNQAVSTDNDCINEQLNIIANSV